MMNIFVLKCARSLIDNEEKNNGGEYGVRILIH
nr:MAG TPA: hypothetical protein [Caudoviricetes sp.]